MLKSKGKLWPDLVDNDVSQIFFWHNVNAGKRVGKVLSTTIFFKLCYDRSFVQAMGKASPALLKFSGVFEAVDRYFLV